MQWDFKFFCKTEFCFLIEIVLKPTKYYNALFLNKLKGLIYLNLHLTEVSNDLKVISFTFKNESKQQEI